jgi:chromosome segregation ATPase
MERIEDLEQTTREHEREIFDMDPYKRAVEELMSSRTPQRLTVGEERINALTVANAFFLAKVEALEQRNDTLMQQNTGLECTVIKLEAEQMALADTIKQIQANVAELETGKRKRLEDGNASLEDDKRQRS